MTKQKSTKRALLMSALALLMCVSMLIGSTFAWFTDSVTSGSNVITAGNLDIVVEYTLDGENWNKLDGATDLFQKGLWEPGHTEVVALRITNNGSLALKYAANMNIIDETIGKTKGGKDIVLSDILTVSTLIQQAADKEAANQVGDITLALAFNGENTIAYNEPITFKAGNILGNNETLLPGDAQYVIVKVDMAETVGNEANHNGTDIPTINFGINVLATQFTYEYDSFGNQYDKDATYPVISVDALKDAFANNAKIVEISGTIDGGAEGVGANQGFSIEYIARNTEKISGGKLVLDENTKFGIWAYDVASISDMEVIGDSEAVLYIQAYNKPGAVSNVSVTANGGAGIYGEFCTKGLVLENCNVKQTGLNTGYLPWFNAAVLAANGSKITINSGTYESDLYAVSTLGSPNNPSTVTINGGTFIGGLNVANGDSMIINGGTFSVDPSTVAGVTVNGTVVNNGNGTWTVAAN